MEFLYDTNFWYLVSFIGFAAIIWKYGKPALISYIDNRIEEIREEIATAENLRVEAQGMLAQYQRKHKDAVKDADHILETAKKQAAEIQKQAEIDLDETIARREKQLAERLSHMEENAKEEIRQYAASLAITATSEIIATKFDKKANEKLVDAAIRGVSDNIH